MKNGLLLRRTLALTALFAAATLHAQAQAPAVETPQQEGVSESIQSLVNSYSWLVPQWRYTNGPHLRAVFRPVVGEVREATVEVRSKQRRVAYGGIVGPDGWVVTKASLVQGPVTCRLRDGREFAAVLVGVDAETDLAMLKIDAKNLPTLQLTGQLTGHPSGRLARETTQTVAIKSESPAAVEAPSAEYESTGELQAGDWLATVGVNRDPIAVGVVSVLPRKIEKSPGVLGVQIDINYVAPQGATPGVRIEKVLAGGAGIAAGLEDGDFIAAVNGVPTADPQGLKGAIASRNPGDRVELNVLRGENKLTLIATLHEWAPNPAERRAHYQNHLGGDLSERRFGFPSALQHDTVLSPSECGGPVVDLDGRVVAFNIARAGRTESYALPTEVVRSRLLDLMSGRLAPVGL